MISEGLISLFYLFRKRREYQTKEEVSTISIVVSHPLSFSGGSYMRQARNKKTRSKCYPNEVIWPQLTNVCWFLYCCLVTCICPLSFYKQGWSFEKNLKQAREGLRIKHFAYFFFQNGRQIQSEDIYLKGNQSWHHRRRCFLKKRIQITGS